MIKIIERDDIIAGAVDAWTEQYSGARWHTSPRQHEITEALNRLHKDQRTRENIDRIIGNNSWTCLNCDLCGSDVERVVRIGENPDYYARWQDVCQDCLQECQDTLSQALTERGLA
jgi:hypothetical protein